MSEAKQKVQNPHHPDHKQPTSLPKKCGLFLLALLALFCLICVYRDLKGLPSDPVEVLKAIRNSVRFGQIYNQSKAIGKEVAFEMADSPEYEHFHQYPLPGIWETYTQKISDFFSQLFQGEQPPSEPPKWQTVTEEKTMMKTPEGMKTVIVKEVKTCTMEGEEEKCVKTKTEEVIQPNSAPKISGGKKEEEQGGVVEDKGQVKEQEVKREGKEEGDGAPEGKPEEKEL